MTYSTVKYVPDPRRFISFLFSYSIDEKSAFQPLRCPCSDRECKSPLIRRWRSFCDGGNEWEGNTDFVTPIIRGGWLLAQLAILILKVLSLTRPRAQMSSQIQLFSASDTLIKVGPDTSDQESVCVCFWWRTWICVILIKNLFIHVFGSRHLPQVHSVCYPRVLVFILPPFGGFVYFSNSFSP